MKKFICSLIISAILCCQSSFAADLVDVYRDAVHCDPTFKAAMAELMADRQNVPISRAALLPRVDIHADTERQLIQFTGINFTSFQSTGIFIPIADTTTFYNNSVNYRLRASQPLFNYKNWAKLQQSKASVLQAEASFCASVQNLIVRVVRAYFDVLLADTNLFYTQEHKKAVAEQLRQTKEQLKVGVVPRADLSEAQANYDLIIAEEIANRYELAQKIEALRSITNHLYGDVQGLSAYLPLVVPQPTNINTWVSTTEKQNYQLLAARYATLAARENIKVQSGDRFPVVNSYGQFSFDYDSNYRGSNVLLRDKTAEGGLELSWAPIQGGGITAHITQSQYQFQKSCQDQEFIHRQVISEARDAYLGVFAGIAQVRADREAIRSSQVSLKATMDGYKAGTRTILNVLNQQTQLYSVEKIFAKARYEYIYQTILLKQAAGTLSVCDLQYVNAWLYSKVNISHADAFLEGCLIPNIK